MYNATVSMQPFRPNLTSTSPDSVITRLACPVVRQAARSKLLRYCLPIEEAGFNVSPIPLYLLDCIFHCLQTQKGCRRTSPPISRILISFSISTNCCSSAKASAHGTPNNSALVLTTQSVFPLNINPDLTQLVVASTLPAIYDRVVGGIISRRARSRSVRVSSSGILSSSSVEISDSDFNVRLEIFYALSWFGWAYRYQCSSRHRLGRLALSQRTRPRLLLIRPFWQMLKI